MTYFQYVGFVVINWVVGRGKVWCGGVGTYICKVIFIIIYQDMGNFMFPLSSK